MGWATLTYSMHKCWSLIAQPLAPVPHNPAAMQVLRRAVTQAVRGTRAMGSSAGANPHAESYWAGFFPKWVPSLGCGMGSSTGLAQRPWNTSRLASTRARVPHVQGEAGP